MNAAGKKIWASEAGRSLMRKWLTGKPESVEDVLVIKQLYATSDKNIKLSKTQQKTKH